MKTPAPVKRRTIRVIRVFCSPVDRTRGRMRAGNIELVCALGRAGPVRRKREGDGGTPIGRFRILGGYLRVDRLPVRPGTPLPMRSIRRDLGWCDDPRDRAYNRPIALPARASHERMWRDDPLYDLVYDLSYNRRPAVPGRGSAIFLHSARPDFTPTEGCVAVSRTAIVRLGRLIGPHTTLHVIA